MNIIEAGTGGWDNLEKVRNDIYNIYKGYSLKDITSEKALKDIIDYISDVNYYSKIPYTKHMHSSLVRLVVKFIIEINPKHPLFYKFLERNIVESGLTKPTIFYLYDITERYFPSKVERLQRFILRKLPIYFSKDNIRFDGTEVIKAGLHTFLFQTYKTLGTYFPNSKYQFKWDYTFNGFSNGNILIINKNTYSFTDDMFNVEYSFGAHKRWKTAIKNGKKHFFISEKYLIPLLHVGFALQIYKLTTESFSESALIISFSNNDDIPIKISYKDCNIVLYFFKEPLRNADVVPQQKEKNRADVIELNYF